LPLEMHCHHAHFLGPPLSDASIVGKPTVLLIGPYSVGKTSFIQHLLGDPEEGIPGANVGPEPTTDGFMAVMHGPENKTILGHVCAADREKPFGGLNQFGSSLLDKFQCAECPAEILKGMTLIDTPGVLSGEKQRLGRKYDMAEVCKWFADQSDAILLMFDAHKQDISDELKEVILKLQGNEGKIRIILNKADQVSQ
jgi:GTPase SAR1 family protein